MISFPYVWHVFILMVDLRVFALEKFTAAVYEHAVVQSNSSSKSVSSEEALTQLKKNMDILDKAIKSAAKQGAHIIVTPEDGVYGFGLTREIMYPYLEDIPHPDVNWIPCSDPKRFGNTPVLEWLSCAAKNNSIYVVANIGDKKDCNSTDPKCPSDKHYQYNTDVVFDSDGKLVARYHKFNLFIIEYYFDSSLVPQVVTFNTTFGTFGIFTCFDILFHDPAITLVNKNNVDTILFPTAWMNVLPHLTAIQFHSAWAMGMRVNVLASNIHKVHSKMTGSGIYAPDGPQFYHYDAESDNGHLVVGELYSKPSLSPTYPPRVKWNSYAANVTGSPKKQNFTGTIFFDEYNFSELTEEAGNLTVCQKDLCCHLSYRMKEKQKDELYVLGSFDGLHVVEGKYYLQICILLKCKSKEVGTCGQPVTAAQTLFNFFSLSGTFGTDYVFPEVLLSGIQLAPGEFQVLSDGRLISQNGTSKPVLTVALFGRWYEKDPPHKHV